MPGVRQFAVFKYDFFEIFPGFAFQGGVPQQGRRMVYRHGRTVEAGDPCTALPADPVVGARHVLQGRSTRQNENLRVDKLYLLQQPGKAYRRFYGGEDPVPRGSATHDIADENMFFAGEAASGRNPEIKNRGLFLSLDQIKNPPV